LGINAVQKEVAELLRYRGLCRLNRKSLHLKPIKQEKEFGSKLPSVLVTRLFLQVFLQVFSTLYQLYP